MTSDPLARFLNQRSARFQRRGRLRPMESNEILDAAVGAYQNLGGIILRYTAIPTLFCLASVIFVIAYLLPELGVTSDAANVTVQVGEAVGVMAIGLFVAAPLFMLGVSYSSAFICGLVSDFMVGNPADPAYHAKRARELMPRLFGLTVWEVLTALSGLVASALLFMASALLDKQDPTSGSAPLVSLLAILAVIFGGIAFPFVLLRQALAIPAVVIENLRARAAARRSVELMNSRLYHPSGYNAALGMFALISVVGLFVFSGIWGCLQVVDLPGMLRQIFSGAAAHDFVLQALNSLPWFLTIWILVPIWCTNATILYYERRTRLEGFDIEALAEDLKAHAKQNRFDL